MAALEGADEPTLKKIFETGWEAQRKVDSGEMSSNTDDYKLMVIEGVTNLEKATVMVNQLNIFSDNESVDELSTSDLKYLLLPGLLGELTLQVATDNRVEVLHKAKVYFIDYLQRAKSYAITEEEPPSATVDESSVTMPTNDKEAEYKQAAADRQTKITRLRAKKDMEKNINVLAEKLKTSQEDDLIREHLLAVLQYWVIRCQENVASTEQEVQLLEGMGRLSTAPRNYPRAEPPRQASTRPPLTITRDMIQAGVFGTGYPSLPSLSVEEFFDQQYGDQQVASGPTPTGPTPSETEQLSDDEKDDEESLRRAREYDEYKDYNRRGDGNRKNMG